jgi:hypothetical protein
VNGGAGAPCGQATGGGTPVGPGGVNGGMSGPTPGETGGTSGPGFGIGRSGPGAGAGSGVAGGCGVAGDGDGGSWAPATRCAMAATPRSASIACSPLFLCMDGKRIARRSRSFAGTTRPHGPQFAVMAGN